MWFVFFNDDLQTKRHLPLDNIFKDNHELGKCFDMYCKKYMLENRLICDGSKYN